MGHNQREHIENLIRALSEPTAYPLAVKDVTVRQTHASVVFLAGEDAYKVKKPVDLGFLDYSSLERRYAACRAEVALNRRLAPDVYLGVAAIHERKGKLVLSSDSDSPVPEQGIAEWTVHMRRLPDSANLAFRLDHGLDASEMTQVALRLSAFHKAAERGPEVSACARLQVVKAELDDVLAGCARQIGDIVSERMFERVRLAAMRELSAVGPLIEARAFRGVPCDGHGDLRLEHIYTFPSRRPPNDLVIIDCVEFADHLRRCDPICDIAFLVMELELAGRGDLAGAFLEEYLRASADREGRTLVPFFVAYRSLVRALVRQIQAADRDIPEDDRSRAMMKARVHWSLALSALECRAKLRGGGSPKEHDCL